MLKPIHAASLTATLLTSLLTATPPPAAHADEVLLFPYFRGGEGAFLMYSLDGRRFYHVNDGEPIYSASFPGGNDVVRDPSIVLGPDNRFWMTFTPRFFNQHIGYASSDDLISWNDGLHRVWEPDAQVVNAWAPEVHYDASSAEYVILFASTDRRRYPNSPGEPPSPTPSEDGPSGVDRTTGEPTGGAPLAHRIYRVTTTDFETFSEPDLFFDPGFNVIDSQIVRDDRGTAAPDDDRFVMVFKDERTHTNRPTGLVADRRKTTHFAVSDRLQGDYRDISAPITGRGSPAATYSGDSEGQALVRFRGEWLLFIDPYTDRGLTYTVHRQLESSRGLSSDPTKWVEITRDVSFPFRTPADVAHGTPFVVDRDRVAHLLPSDSPGVGRASGIVD